MDENTSVPVGFSTGKKELWMLAVIIFISVFMVNTALYHGLNLGFALILVLCTGASALYLTAGGCKATPYSSALLILSVICAASFARSDDGLVKFVMLCFCTLGSNLGLCLLAGQNRRSPAGVTSLLDAPRAAFVLGVGQLSHAAGGLKDSIQNAGTAGKNRTAALMGLLVAVPVVAVLIPLLIRADAAFEGLIGLLPQVDLTQIMVSLIIGIPLSAVIYTRNAALQHKGKDESAKWVSKSIHPVTINTVLGAVCIVYAVYLISQLAYFVGGFSGLLPEGFTMAQYARRGFFEMAWLSFLNLTIMTASVALVATKNGRAPLLTRLLCLFIGMLSMFFVGTASAKMLMYIGSYGLTRLRLLTEVIMVFIAFTVMYVAVWLFHPKFSYMKAVMLTALCIGAAVAWTDVDTAVAAYNVGAYQSGKLQTVDMQHLRSLGDGAVPYLQELAEGKDITLRTEARSILSRRSKNQNEDLWDWNIASGQAKVILEQYNQPKETDPAAEKLKALAYRADATELADILYPYSPEDPEKGDILTLVIKDEAVFFESGEILEPFWSYDAHLAMDDAGVGSILVSEYYVVFQPAATDAYCMLWTRSPDKAMEILWEEYPLMEPEHLIDQWYFLSFTP